MKNAITNLSFRSTWEKGWCYLSMLFAAALLLYIQPSPYAVNSPTLLNFPLWIFGLLVVNAIGLYWYFKKKIEKPV